MAVYFHDGAGDRAFDVEWVSHIRAGADHEVRVAFRPATCGTHTLAVATHPERATSQATLEVAMGAPARPRRSRGARRRASRCRSARNTACSPSSGPARTWFDRGDASAGLTQLRLLEREVDRQRGRRIPVADADALLAELVRILGWIRA